MISIQCPTLPASVVRQETTPDNEQALAQLAALRGSFQRKIVVLDDDPTGVQTVHGLSVYTDWLPETMDRAFSDAGDMFFILTNSRGMTVDQTTETHRQLARNIYEAAERCHQQFIIISRSDSTLRGHYPLETNLLREQLEALGHPRFDGEILYPFFLEGGRFTLDNTHYVLEGDHLTPAGQTEFARDKSFGYSHSYLPNWCEEKTQGRTKAEEVCCITLDDLRSGSADRVVQKLEAVCDFGKVVVNSTCYADVALFSAALMQVLNQGGNYIIRGAAAIAKVLGGVPDKPLLSRDQLMQDGLASGGVIVVGSYVHKTTRQLQALKQSSLPITYIEFDARKGLDELALHVEVSRVIELVQQTIAKGQSVCVYTTREVVSLEGADRDTQLELSVRISDALTGVIRNLEQQPAFIIAKGGITSYDVGVRALGVRQATVMGQIKPGIPVWMTGPESKFPGMPYIIFPGNVGDEQTLRDIVATLIG